jgi:rhodanese-related sulfurtransferase
MKAWISSVVVVASLVASAALAGEVNEMTVPQVVELAKAGKATLVDANLTEYRAKHGVIPGAVLLTSYNQYDVAKELPQDRAAKLVFYCANRKCAASHFAASRAVEAGYTDVSLMPEGLHGWRTSGQPLVKVPQS